MSVASKRAWTLTDSRCGGSGSHDGIGFEPESMDRHHMREVEPVSRRRARGRQTLRRSAPRARDSAVREREIVRGRTAGPHPDHPHRRGTFVRGYARRLRHRRLRRSAVRRQAPSVKRALETFVHDGAMPRDPRQVRTRASTARSASGVLAIDNDCRAFQSRAVTLPGRIARARRPRTTLRTRRSVGESLFILRPSLRPPRGAAPERRLVAADKPADEAARKRVYDRASTVWAIRAQQRAKARQVVARHFWKQVMFEMVVPLSSRNDTRDCFEPSATRGADRADASGRAAPSDGRPTRSQRPRRGSATLQQYANWYGSRISAATPRTSRRTAKRSAGESRAARRHATTGN